MARLPFTEATLKRLFAVSGNKCAFPNCNHTLVDSQGNIFAQICHIEAAAEKGERFNEDSNDEYRRSYDNLLLMCYDHHIITNDVILYPTAKLKEIKANHEILYLSNTFDVQDELVKKMLDKIEFNVKVENNIINTTNLPEKIVERLLKDLDKAEIEISEKETKFKEMERQYNEAIERLAAAGKEDKESVEIKQFYEEGKFDEAEIYLKEKIKQGDKKTAERYFKLGNLKSLQLNYFEAKDNYLKAIDFDPENIPLLNEIAMLFRDLDNANEALNFFSQARDLTIEHFGHNSQLLIFYYSQMAGIYLADSKISEAEELLNKGKHLLENAESKDPFATAQLYNLLGLLAKDKFDYKGSIAYFEECLLLHNKYLTNIISPMEIGAIYNNLCLITDDIGDYPKSLYYGFKGLEVLKGLGAKHPKIGLVYNSISRAYFHKGDFEMAIHYSEESIKILTSAYGEKHSGLFIAYNTIAQVKLEQRNWKGAIQSLEKALEIIDGLKDKDQEFYGWIFGNLGVAYFGLNNHSEAMKYHTMALETDLKNFGENNLQTATDYANLSIAYQFISNQHEADALLQKAYDIRKKLLPLDHYEMGIHESNQGNQLMERGEFKKAIPHLREAIRILKKTVNLNHPRLEVAANSLERCLMMR